MEEQFVTYEIALKLKELGFDEYLDLDKKHLYILKKENIHFMQITVLWVLV